MKKVLMVGYWGGFNVGDEGFLEIVLPRLKHKAHITVASKNPENTTKSFNVRSVKAEPLTLVRELLRNDIVLEGPGAYSKTLPVLKVLFYYFLPPFLGKLSVKRSISMALA